ncbi:MAG: phospholipase D family protein [Ilumatobacteraceae bacterium]
MPVGDWFLTADERGNPDTSIDRRRGTSWSEGNDCQMLVHGATYYANLYEELNRLESGDTVLFADWRGDADECLMGPGTEVAAVFGRLAKIGVNIHGLLWRSHPDQARFSEQENLRLADLINDAGGEVFVDERVRRVGCHHQKVVVIRHRAGTGRDVAYVGGIDLSHGRRDDEHHQGDPQTIAIDHRYGPRPAWHDLQVAVDGPAIGDIEHTFRERWDDPEPLIKGLWSRLLARFADQPARPRALAAQHPDPEPTGGHAVQVLRTYPAKRRHYQFASEGERSVARAYLKSFKRARSLVYIEDQYLWSVAAAEALAQALERQPDLRVVVVVPTYPDEDGRVSGAANRVSQLRALGRMAAAGGGRFAVYDLERADGTPIYVHAKVCIIDDVWMMAGSDNFDRRSWTHDSELSLAIIDENADHRPPLDPGGMGDMARVLSRSTRLQLWGEHLQRDDVAVDPIEGFEMLAASAAAVDAWYDSGRIGPRPPGRLRRHRPAAVAWWARPVAEAFYHLVTDPDGRPLSLRRRHTY